MDHVEIDKLQMTVQLGKLILVDIMRWLNMQEGRTPPDHVSQEKN
jgi:hypothetical protein